MTEMSTIFDAILARRVPARIVYEDEWVMAFEDINPQAPVHVLVIPKQKLSGFAQLAESDPAQVGQFMVRIAQIASQLGLDSWGYRVVFNQGDHGQQTVPYIHAHILGGRPMSWPPG